MTQNLNNSLENSMLSLQELNANLGQQMQQVNVKDCTSSLIIADDIVDRIIHSVAHIQYMKEIELKVLPYVLSQTKIQALQSLRLEDFQHDVKLDDKYIMLTYVDENEDEPQSQPPDTFRSVTKVRVKEPSPTLPNKGHLFSQHSSRSSLIHKKQSDTSIGVRPTSQLSNKSKKSKSHVKLDTSKVHQLNKQEFNERASPIDQISHIQVNTKPNTKNSGRLITAQSEAIEHMQSKKGTSKLSVTNFDVKTVKAKHKNRTVNNHHTADALKAASSESNTRRNNHEPTLQEIQEQEQARHQDRVIQIDWKHPNKMDPATDPLADKLALLRVEVQKRDNQRKFDAMTKAESKRFSLRKGIGQAAQAGTHNGGVVTTDSHGNMLQVRQSARGNFPQAIQAEAIISQNQETQRRQIERTINFKHMPSSITASSLSLNKDPSQKSLAGAASAAAISIVQKELTPAEIERANAIRQAELLLGNTVSSNFANKKNDKSFRDMQIVDYQQSVQMHDINDGVSMRMGQDHWVGKHKRHASNRNENGLSSRQSVLEKLKSYHQSQMQQQDVSGIPTLNGMPDQVSFISMDNNMPLQTPNGFHIRSIDDLDSVAIGTPNSQAMAKQPQTYIPTPHEAFSDQYLINNQQPQSDLMNTDESHHFMNQSLMSTVSKKNDGTGKSRSMMRKVGGRYAHGKIHQNNQSEVASYLADEMQEATYRALQSRNDRTLHDISQQSSRDYQNHTREDSISRLLGKQQSEMRLLARNPGRNQKSSLTSSINHAKYLRNVNKKQISSHSGLETYADDEQPNIGGVRQGPSSALQDGNASSFSYLPTIQGVSRNKLLSGTSTDLVPINRRKYQGYPATGKSPILMTNHRRLGNNIKLNSGGGIKLADPKRAREIFATHEDIQINDAKDQVRKAGYSAAKGKLLMSKGQDFIKSFKGNASSAQKPKRNNLVGSSGSSMRIE